MELTAGNSKGALLPVEGVELQVHWAGKSQRHPGKMQWYCLGQVVVRERSQWGKFL